MVTVSPAENLPVTVPVTLMVAVRVPWRAPPLPVPDAYAVVPDAAALPAATRTVEALRAAGVAVQLHAGGGSMKSQFKKADGSGAQFALIFGGDELARGEVTLKSLRDGVGAQQAVSLADVATSVAQSLAQPQSGAA